MSEVHSSAQRPPPVPPRIPDHEVLRCIGRGSYGEVWMARAVTGALRAVKVVRREDFELERTFEREFEGIRSFEPISRSHPGMIDILHVGRNPNEGFYYYVMELADDRYGGRSINPADYECRTLGTDKRNGGQLEMDSITEVGLLLADALAHLHHHGLIHRDVKPSNIIFVDGVAQLADIGLVAAYGQRTYVGTEGFVPPEGPGTPQADTYSLGMVLYELSTGQDRLEFPAVPADMKRVGDKKKWRALNEVVCRACAPDPRQRYAHADEMADDLRRVLEGRRTKRKGLLRRKRFWLGTAVLLLAAAQAGKWGRQPEIPPTPSRSPATAGRPGDEPPFVGPPAPPPRRVGRLHVASEPAGAEVVIAGQSRGVTPLDLPALPAGETTVTLQLARHREATRSVSIDPERPAEVSAKLEFWSPPVPGEPWVNSLGQAFVPNGPEHIAAIPTTSEHFVQANKGEFVEGEVLPWGQAGAEPTNYIVFVPRVDAEAYRAWMEARDRKDGFFGPDHFYRIEEVSEGISPTRDDTIRDHLAFRLVAGLHHFGDLVVTSTPAGAEVFEGGRLIGVTPLTLSHRPAGPVGLELKLGGFLPAKVVGEILPNERLDLAATLERSLLAVFDKEWQNSLGMIFRPIEGVQFSIWETRVRDYDAFVAVSGRPHTTDLDQAPDHPVVAVDRDDALAFCQWLTQKEHREGRLEAGWHYRLPADAEWSVAAGTPAERGSTPRERGSKIRGIYPWGYRWPPPAGSGNFADQSAAGKFTLEKPGDRLLPGNDGFSFTAPVGSFSPSPAGLYDLAGNVWEWVMEDFGEGVGTSNYSTYGVVRGGGWSDYRKDNLLSSFRNAVPVQQRESHLGFRVVLARGGK